MSSISSVNRSQELSPITSAGRIDPYAIFQLNFEARGGEKHVKNDKTFKYTGEMKINDTVFELEEFVKIPLMSMRKISSNFKVLYRSGDDGKNLWAFQDDKLTSFDDSESPEREVRKNFEEYKYTDPKDRFFTSKATRRVSINGVNCFEIKITNRKTNEVITHYYDAETFLLKREIKDSGSQKIQTDFSNYKDVGNVKMPFNKDITYLDTGAKQSITYSKIERNIYISDSKFMAPEEKNKKKGFSTSTGVGSNVDTYV